MKQRIAALAIGAVLVWAAATPVQAQHPPQSLQLIAREAMDGDEGAQLLYGLAYLEGRSGLQPDAEKAVYWFRRAARAGHPYAQMMLGNLYADGRGVGRNPEKAVYWWRKAARADVAAAQYRLGKARLDGFGTEKSPMRAVHWLTKAAENGNDDAQFLLGKMYHEGYGVAQDVDLARDWLSRAAAHGHSDAINLLGILNEARELTTMVYQQSADVLREKAERGDPQAQYELGLRYESGAWDVVRNDQQALRWITKAAEGGNVQAMKTLVHVYAQGELGVTADPALSRQWQERSVRRQ